MNIVQIGYGYWGANVAKNIVASKKSTLYAMCDNRIESINQAKILYRDNIKYSIDYRSFLDDPNVDAFAVVTQTDPSFEIAMDVLKAGKHLFIEKPIASNSERAKMICDLALQRNLIVHCDHIMVFHPIIRYIKRMYDSGDLGDLIYIDINRVNLGPIRTDVNAMLDLAVHDLAVIDYLSNGKEPKKINIIGDKFYGEQETLTYLTLNYPDFLAHIKSSWISPLKERRIVIGGTKKMLIFDDMKNVDKLTVYDQGILQETSRAIYGNYEFKVRTGDILAPYIPNEDALLNSIEHFVDCCQSNTPSLSGPGQALRVVRILDSAMSQL